MALRGRPPGSLDKPFRDALRLAVNECQDDKKKLRAIAEQLVERAISGDVQAIKEVADRLDGRSPQALTVTADASEEFIQALKAVSDGVGTAVAVVEDVATEVRH